jgi:predicted MFS family arabinose efflux permease
VADFPPAPRHVLPAITLAQFCGTSLWFAVNAVMQPLQAATGWPASAVGTLTSAVQLGFILGTLVFSLLAVADRHSPRWVFLLCSLAGAACALAAAWLPPQFETLVLLRAATGFCLAGIYPVGMKIAALWYPRGLGAALGVIVGALVLGSAAPHAMRALGVVWPWQTVLLAVAALAAAGGVLLFVALPERGGQRPATLQWRALGSLWTWPDVRASVLGYFGHMWELYTFWVLVPAILATRLAGAPLSWAAFGVMAAGAAGCAGGGWLAQRLGSARVASAQLAASGLCCLAAPWMLGAGDAAFAAWLAVWGVTVAGDSPQFSALTARNAPPAAVGSVLTLTNSIGFAISIVSIQLFVLLAATVPLAQLLPWLAPGPALGLWAMHRLWRRGA